MFSLGCAACATSWLLPSVSCCCWYLTQSTSPALLRQGLEQGGLCRRGFFALFHPFSWGRTQSTFLVISMLLREFSLQCRKVLAEVCSVTYFRLFRTWLSDMARLDFSFNPISSHISSWPFLQFPSRSYLSLASYLSISSTLASPIFLVFKSRLPELSSHLSMPTEDLLLRGLQSPVLPLWSFLCFGPMSACLWFPRSPLFISVVCGKTCLYGMGRAEYWLWGEERTVQQHLEADEGRKKKTELWEDKRSVINLKDDGKAPLAQNKNSEANKTSASSYYNLFVGILFFFSPSPASSVIVFLYVRCPEMCLHLCLESI